MHRHTQIIGFGESNFMLLCMLGKHSIDLHLPVLSHCLLEKAVTEGEVNKESILREERTNDPVFPSGYSMWRVRQNKMRNSC